MSDLERTLPKKRGYYLLNTDGGMVNDGKRKPGDAAGTAAIAVVLKNSRDRLVKKFAKSIGPATNDVAEYEALIVGLAFALSLGVERIRVYVDSEVVVDQMNLVSKVNQKDLRDLHKKARDLLQQFADFRISWVPRERNQEADGLVRGVLYG
jgi:ribonuclease HI